MCIRDSTWALQNLPPQTTGGLCFGIFPLSYSWSTGRCLNQCSHRLKKDKNSFTGAYYTASKLLANFLLFYSDNLWFFITSAMGKQKNKTKKILIVNLDSRKQRRANKTECLILIKKCNEKNEFNTYLISSCVKLSDGSKVASLIIFVILYCTV